MNCAPVRIVEMYEGLDMTPEEISMDEGLEVEVVKACLARHSAKYLEQNGGTKKAGKDITDAEYQVLMTAYKSLALNAEDEGVRERALRNCINEYKGRNDVKESTLGGGNVNLIVLNESIQKARAAIERSRGRRAIPDVDELKSADPARPAELVEEAA